MYKIVVPSYKRVDVFKKKTLNYLSQTNVDMNNVYLFVANEDEAKSYSCFGLKNVVVGVVGIKNQRNFIRNYFNQGEKIFSLDDDIGGIWKATTVKQLDLVTDLNGLIDRGFQLAENAKTKLWGVSAVKNGFFMYGKKVSYDLKYIVGACFGQVIDKDEYLNQTIDDKGDYERSILYYKKFGSVVRFNDIAIETNYYKTQGGMQVERTKERVRSCGLYLLNKYPQYCLSLIHI